MLWLIAFHLIFVVTWFAGVFYLPRLFVYHAQAKDEISDQRFKVMEKKLLYAITLPSAIIATVLGLWIMSLNTTYYLQAGWMHAKLTLVAILWLYNIFCIHYTKLFKHNKNTHSHIFYRWFNEVPAVILVLVVTLVVVKPF